MADNEEIIRANQLIDQINRLERENGLLEIELDNALRNMGVLAANLETMAQSVMREASALETETRVLDEDAAQVERAIEDLSRRYFTFKTLSTATKNLTRSTDEYYTRFSFYHRLRRIALGYVIGLDNEIISSETLRKEVEKIYLQNTDYWLAYALAAVMLWASDEREAAERAMHKSLSMDDCRTAVFFLLINLRFERLDAAKNWYLDYLDKADLRALGSEYQYLLQAYLCGLFGPDADFEAYVRDNFQKAIVRVDATTADLGGRVSQRAKEYAQTYLHVTERSFPTLAEISRDYDSLISLLSRAECNGLFARRFAELAGQEFEQPEDQAQRVENVLYDLINAYDDEEWQVVKTQKYNEAIIEARGDAAAAQRNYDLQYANLDRKRSLDQLMMDWAFSDDPTITNLMVKRFAIAMMKEPIARGFEEYAAEYREREPETVQVEIDGCSLACREDNAVAQAKQLEQHYEKSRVKQAFQDKYVQIFGIVCLASVLLLVFTAFRFSPVAVTIGVLGGIIGGFVLWRRLVEVRRIGNEKKRLGLLKLQRAEEELRDWRNALRAADAQAAEVRRALRLFE